MYGSPEGAAATRNEYLSPPFPPASTSEDSDLLLLLPHRHHLQPQQQMMSSGLLRYKSAPSSLLGEIGDDFLNPASGSELSDFWDNSSNAYRVVGPSPSPPPQPMPTHGDLIRQSSFPTASFHLNVDNGCGPMAAEDRCLGPGGGRSYNPVSFPSSSWDDSLPLANNNSSSGRNQSDLNPSDLQNAEVQQNHRAAADSGLTHQLSLPLTASEMAAAVDKFGPRFRDAVPCRIRAKRGCATHPRSIAERVRRTRISERMRKLQVVVPNMDKQTSTADMLDLAVDYIKDLEKQVKTLKESMVGCACSSSKS